MAQPDSRHQASGGTSQQCPSQPSVVALGGAMVEGAHSLEVVSGRAIVTLIGEHDLSTKAGVEGVLQDAAAAYSHVIVDLHRCDFIDSSIIGLFVRASQSARPDGSFALLAPAGTATPVLRVLELTKLHLAVCIHDSLSPIAPTAAGQ